MRASSSKSNADAPPDGERYASVREFLERVTPAGEKGALEEAPLPPMIMCHVFLLSCVMERTANRVAENHGLTLSQWKALGCIGNGGENGIAHSELCNRLMLSKAPVTGIVDRLERDGYVRRTANPKDRRMTCICIKAKGEAAWRRVRDDLRTHAMEHCTGFSEAEQSTFVDLLSRLLDAVARIDQTLPEGNAAQSSAAPGSSI
jgi:DNA-binding MarR family transcriptional regulator